MLIYYLPRAVFVLCPLLSGSSIISCAARFILLQSECRSHLSPSQLVPDLPSLQAGHWQRLISTPPRPSTTPLISPSARPIYRLRGAFCWLRNHFFFCSSILFQIPFPIYLTSDYFYFFLLLLLFFWYFLQMHLLILFLSCVWAAGNLFHPHYLRLTIPPTFLDINHSGARGNCDFPKSSHYISYQGQLNILGTLVIIK